MSSWQKEGLAISPHKQPPLKSKCLGPTQIPIQVRAVLVTVTSPVLFTRVIQPDAEDLALATGLQSLTRSDWEHHGHQDQIKHSTESFPGRRHWQHSSLSLFHYKKSLGPGFKENASVLKCISIQQLVFNYLSELILNSSSAGKGLTRRAFPAYVGVSVLPRPHSSPTLLQKTLYFWSYICLGTRVLFTRVTLVSISTSNPSFSGQNYFWIQKLEFRPLFCSARLRGQRQQLCNIRAHPTRHT